MSRQLPEISALLWPAFLSLGRGVHITETGIQLERTYQGVNMDDTSLRDFVEHFGFATDTPLCYLYTLIQRAQLHLMLSKEFTIASLGMVHLENYLTKHAVYRPQDSFELRVSVTVDYKVSGSLIPVSVVEVYQRGQLIATNKSVYLAKRKSKTKRRSKKHAAPASWGLADYQQDWTLAASLGKVYASLSGDRNLIHTSTVFAKLMGFERRILHGWYSVCAVEQTVAEVYGKAATTIAVKFLAPVLLPSSPCLALQAAGGNIVRYRLVRPADAKVLLWGELTTE